MSTDSRTRSSRPVPVTDDPATAGLFAAASRGVLAVRMCRVCELVVHVPIECCPRCGSDDTEWRATSGTGRVYTWTTVEHGVHPAFDIPYALVLVELDDHPGVRFLGHMPGRPDLEVGDAMEVWFERCGPGAWMPQWRRSTR